MKDKIPEIWQQINQVENSFSVDKESTVHRLFEQQVLAHPDKTAIVFEKQSVTYVTLNKRANALAGYLKNERGIKQGAIVSLLLPVSIDMLVAILGVLKAGAAYSAIDMELPGQRVEKILGQSGAGLLITTTAHANAYQPVVQQVVAMGVFEEGPWREAEENTVGCSDDLAAILYTSGSTGMPKGVMIEHRSIIRLVKNNNFCQTGPNDVILNTSSYAFDATLYTFFSALLNGATLVLVGPKAILDIKNLARTIKKHKATITFITTAFFNVLADADIYCFNGLRKVLIGGEVCSVRHAGKFINEYGAGILLNVYGPTENTTFSTWYAVDEIRNGTNSIPIGKPVAGSSCYILDEEEAICDFLQPGELCVGGMGLARGYLGEEALWQSKRIPHPLIPGQYLYRTGDFASLLPDGNIGFIGRKDNQVKIRGYRIELSDVENSILLQEGVQMVKVIADEKEGGKLLKAFIVLGKDNKITNVKDRLRNQLPEYMIPELFYEVKEIPFTPNGKTDVNHLLANEGSYRSVTIVEASVENELQEKLLELWREVLENEHISAEDSFFDHGGNSMKAIRLVGSIEKKLAIKGRLEEVYRFPTVKRFAESIHKKGSRKVKYFISLNDFSPGRNNFFVMPASWGEENDFNGVAAQMNDKANFFKVQIRGLFEDKLESSLQKLAAFIVGKITRIPKGDVTYIIGYSWAALLAYEVTRQLEPKFGNVKLLLFDYDPYYRIDKATITFDRYKWFTLDFIKQYLPDIETEDQLTRLKYFWMNNNTIHADYHIKNNITSDIYSFEATEHEGSGGYATEGRMQRFDMELWRKYTSGQFCIQFLPGNHSTIVKDNVPLLANCFMALLPARSIPV